MRFQLTAHARYDANDTAQSIAVIFRAATWDDAAKWANDFLSRIGVPSEYETLITYASNTEGFFRNDKAEAPMIGDHND